METQRRHRGIGIKINNDIYIIEHKKQRHTDSDTQRTDIEIQINSYWDKNLQNHIGMDAQ